MTHTTKHTPGPWAVEPRQWDQGASLAIVAPNNGYIVAIVPFDEDIQVVDEPDGDTVRRHPEDVPNAAMLAAAPAMYEALKQTFNVMENILTDSQLDTRTPCGLTIREWESKVRIALAQAEGKQ